MNGQWRYLLIAMALLGLIGCGDMAADPTKKYKNINDKFVPKHDIDSRDQNYPTPDLITVTPSSNANLTTVGTTIFEVEKENAVDLIVNIAGVPVDRVTLEKIEGHQDIKITKVSDDDGNRAFALRWKPAKEFLKKNENWRAHDVVIKVNVKPVDPADEKIIRKYENRYTLRVVVGPARLKSADDKGEEL